MDTVNLRGPGIKFENFEKFENLVLMISRDVFLIRTSCIEDGRRYAENKGRAKKLKFQKFPKFSSKLVRVGLGPEIETDFTKPKKGQNENSIRDTCRYGLQLYNEHLF